MRVMSVHWVRLRLSDGYCQFEASYRVSRRHRSNEVGDGRVDKIIWVIVRKAVS